MQCNCDEKFIKSSPAIGKNYEINYRLVFDLRQLGIGIDGVNKFCGLMDICSGICNDTYYSILDNIKTAAATVHETVLKKAVDEEKKLNATHGNVENHFTGSGDGTWKKRGLSAMFGVSTLIGLHTQKVVDSIVKSTFCQACASHQDLKNEDIDAFNEWFENHLNCTVNHVGRAPEKWNLMG